MNVLQGTLLGNVVSEKMAILLGLLHYCRIDRLDGALRPDSHSLLVYFSVVDKWTKEHGSLLDGCLNNTSIGNKGRSEAVLDRGD